MPYSIPAPLIEHLKRAADHTPAGIHTALPGWLGNASATKRQALKDTIPEVKDWHLAASRQQHAPLKQAMAASWAAQNQVDTALATLASPAQFAAPLLQQALKQQFGVDCDVTTTFVRLYTPVTTLAFQAPTGGVRTWTVSLVDAALHNFDAAECQKNAHTQDSTFITQPSATGQFDTLASVSGKISVEQFTSLCRELDIGQQYQRYIRQFFGADSPVLKAVLRLKVIQSLKAQAQASLHMARLKKDVSDSAFYSLQGQLEGLRGMMLEVKGKPILNHDLSLMGMPLTGIVLFAPDLELYLDAVPMVAYIPDDPQAPLKHYPNGEAFMQDLRTKLRSPDYQAFFSRFVDHEHRGYFFADLNNRLSQVVWHAPSPGDPRPTWRNEPLSATELQLSASKISGDLYEHLYETKLNKLLNDARVIAVATADADRAARWRRWDILEKIGKAIVEIAAFIATPFIPPLGALMLAYTAYQLLDETFEGIIDWALGLNIQAFGHLMSILEQMVQLGMFAVGAPIAEGLLRQALPEQVWAFFDALEPVTSTDGKTRLWNADLNAYNLDVQLPATSYPDNEGLHAHNGKKILPLDGQHFAVEQRPGSAFLQHPTHTHAYRPRVTGNGKGAWVTETDRPLTWDTTTLLRRLGPPAEALSDARLEQARLISGTDPATLRKMYMARQPQPPLLADTLKRINIDQRLQDFIDQMSSDDPQRYNQADAQTQLWLISHNGLWPETKRLRFLNAKGEIIWEFNGHDDAAVVQLHEAQLKNGELLNALLETLDETERKTLLEEPFGSPNPPIAVRVGALRKKLARIAQQQRAELFDSRYRGLEMTDDARLQKIIDSSPGLPISVAEEVMRSASGQELLELDRGNLAPRLIDQARWAAHEVRISRAYEGLYMDALDSADSHRLALHSLENLPGWSPQVRLVVTDYNPTGNVRDAIGNLQAPIRRVLVRSIEGRYVPEGDTGALLGETDFYTAVLQALPDAQRDALGIHIGQGPLLRETLRQHAAPRETLGQLLAQAPLRKPAYDPDRMRLPGGMHGYRASQPSAGSSAPMSLEDRIHDLFPRLTPQAVTDTLAAMQHQPGSPLRTLQYLKREFMRLEADLASWFFNSPQTYLDTALPLASEVIRTEQHTRWIWTQELIGAWRHETMADPTILSGRILRLTRPVYGELPQLSGRFEHITRLELSSYPTTRGTEQFLHHFPQVRRLTISDIALRTLPTEVTARHALIELTLRNCAIRLTTESRAALAALSNLKTLDLANNPLGLAPDLTNVPGLQTLNLSQTGLSQLPAGLALLTRPLSINLSYNQIHALPEALFSLPIDAASTYDLSGNPLSRATLERIKTYCQTAGDHFGADAGAEERLLVHELYPTYTEREASRFIFELPGSLEDSMAHLRGLKADYERLQTDLEHWAMDVPQRHPRTNAPLGEQAQAQQQLVRRQFKAQLEECWRRETALAEPYDLMDNTHELVCALPVMGDLPVLNVAFKHVSRLDLRGEETTSIPDGFIQQFPALRSLLVHRYALQDIPLKVFQLPRLTALSLSQSHINLSPESADALSGMEHLTYLDLSHNPLGIRLNVSHMHLRVLTLENAGLTQAPHGTFAMRSLDELNLSDNQITELPSDIIEVPPDAADGFDLSGNPLTPQTIAMLRRYYLLTDVSFGVAEVRQAPVVDAGVDPESPPPIDHSDTEGEE